MLLERDERGRWKSPATADGEAASDAAGAERERAAGIAKASKPKPKRKPKPKPRAWKKEKEEIFFGELATLCNVSSALRAAGLTGQSSTVYERRRRDPAFRARWQEAIEQSYALLELDMLERARSGGGRPAARTGIEKKLRDVPTALGLQLLKMHQAGAKAREAAAPAPAALRRISRKRARELRPALAAMLSALNLAMGGEG